MDTKNCVECNTVKPIEDFCFVNRAKGYRYYACKECWNRKNKERYAKNRRAEIERSVKNKKLTSLENRKLVFEYLCKHPCVDCGEHDPIVLQFDHVRDIKAMEISRMVTAGYSWETIEAEITKCDVRCSNCHWRQTAKRRGWKMLEWLPK